MKELSIILNSEEDELLNTIPNFQKYIIQSFLEQKNHNYIDAAELWLKSSPSNTAKFGAEQKKENIYRDKLIDEIEKFLCGDEKYDDDRKKIVDSGDKTQKYIIGVMSVAIGKSLGVVGTFIAPVIVLLLLSFGKMAINAWCAMRKENRNTTIDNV
jgi:hypothetical protein